MAEKGKQDEGRKLLFKWRFAFIREEGLTSTQKVVMHTLGAYMDLDGRGCVLGLSRIAKESGLARWTVIRTIQELAGRWLAVTNRRSSCGDSDTNEYCAAIPQGVGTQDDHLGTQDDQGRHTGRLGVGTQDDPTSKSTSNSNSIDTSKSSFSATEMWTVWLEELGGKPPHPKLTDDRKTKLQLLWHEQLRDQDNPLACFRSILRAIKASEFHMSKRAYQLPESTFRDANKRDTWAIEARGNGRARRPHMTAAEVKKWAEN